MITKLNLGCFNKKFPGYINVDIREDVNPDVVDDAFKLEKFRNDSIDEIVCIHMFEHLTFRECDLALARWFEVLKDGGVLRLAVPNIRAVMQHYLYHENLALLYSALWGSQRHDFDFHKSGFDEKTLTDLLNKHGFTQVKWWDWQTTPPHNYIDTYASAYYPDMCKKYLLANGKEVDMGGKLMSLNLEATK